MNILLIAFLALGGCAQFNDRRPVAAPAVEVRDVPFAARGENEAPRPRLLVLPFLEDRPNGDLGEAARPALTRHLVAGGQVTIAGADELATDAKAYLAPGNEYDLARVARDVSPLGVAAVVEGKVLELRVRKLGDTLGLIREARALVSARVRVRVFGGKSGKEIFRGEREAEVESTTTFVAPGASATALRGDPELTRAAIAKAFRTAGIEVLRAVEKLGWQGRVASVAGDRVFINAGRLTGLQVGDILKVTDDGEDIYDPNTGRFIGTAPGRLKGTIEVQTYFGKDGAIATIHSGAGFRQNDHVELY